MTFLIAAMGPGEISQGMAFAKYALSQGSRVIFAVVRNDQLPLITIDHPEYSPILTENADSLKAALKERKPDVLVLCNSKIFNRDRLFTAPDPLPPTLTIDSNWLFFKESPYPSVPWADLYCINIPEPVFELGLEENGGNYRIDPEYRERLRIVGLLPSYERISGETRTATRRAYGIADDEKLIFHYSSIGGLAKPRVFEQALAVTRLLNSRGRKVKMLMFGDKTTIPAEALTEPWFVAVGRSDTDEFYRVLASADLVFQHQGLGTLEQSIAALIPNIANVRDVPDERSPYHAHAWEVGPFANYGACAMFFFSEPTVRVADAAETLLYDEAAREKMRERQATLYSRGEAAVFEAAVQLRSSVRR